MDGDSAEEQVLVRIDSDNPAGASATEFSLGWEKRSCCQKFILSPVVRVGTVFKNGDAQLEVVLLPEAFRLWFYYGLCIFTFIAIFVTKMWSTAINYEDNPIIDKFGANSICIFYDYPPFSYFACFLWFPQCVSILMFEVLDQYRVHDNYVEGRLSKTFYQLYSLSSCFECISFVWFLQCFATSPDENVYIHTLPYFVLIYSLWTLAFKRYMYYSSLGVWNNGKSASLRYLSTAYIWLMLISAIGKSIILFPAFFFDYRSWEQPGLEFTGKIRMICTQMWFILAIFVPIFAYPFMSDHLEYVTFVVNRKKVNHQ